MGMMIPSVTNDLGKFKERNNNKKVPKKQHKKTQKRRVNSDLQTFYRGATYRAKSKCEILPQNGDG